MIFNYFIVFLIFLVSGCATKSEKIITECAKGKTILDGVCIRQDIVDYVGCVRAQGVKINTVNGKSISLGVNYFAIGASSVEDVSKKIEKEYQVSDKSMLAIIEQCNKISNAHVHTLPKSKVEILELILASGKTYYGMFTHRNDNHKVEVSFKKYNGKLKTFKGSVAYMGRQSIAIKSFSGRIRDNSLIFSEDGWIKNGGAWFGLKYTLSLNELNSELVGEYRHKDLNGESRELYLIIK